MACSMMHEIWFGKVMSRHTIRAEYLTKRQKRRGRAFRPFYIKLSFCLLNTVVFLYERLMNFVGPSVQTVQIRLYNVL